MSYIQLRCFINPPGHPEGAPPELHGVAEFKNSHGWGPMIWTALCSRYKQNGMAWLMDPDGLKLSAFPNMTSWERATFLSSCDMALVKAEDTGRWAEALLAFSAKHGDPTRVNHLPDVARLALKALEERPGLVAFCLYASLNEDPWRTYDPESDDHRDYDLTKGESHFFVDFELPPQVPEVPSEEI